MVAGQLSCCRPRLGRELQPPHESWVAAEPGSGSRGPHDEEAG